MIVAIIATLYALKSYSITNVVNVASNIDTNTIIAISATPANMYSKHPQERGDKSSLGEDIRTAISPIRGENTKLKRKAQKNPILYRLPISPTMIASKQPEKIPNSISSIDISTVFKLFIVAPKVNKTYYP